METTLLSGLSVKKSSIPEAGFGVFTETLVTKNTVFGPYDGQVTKDKTLAQDTGYAWLVSGKDTGL